MMAQTRPKLTPEIAQKMLNEMKLRTSQTEGEITSAREENKSMFFNNVAQMLSVLFTENKALTETLDEIYQGHPDIKVTMDAKAKEQAEEAPAVVPPTD